MIDFVFRVRVRLLATEAGGRRGPIFTDYRPNWRLQPEMLNDGRVILDGCSEIAPGGEGMARLVPLVPEFWGAVQVGSVLPMCEGNRVVGEATVSSVARAEHFSPEVLTFVLAARRYCDFVDQAGTLPLSARLTNARLRLLEVYRAACVLPSLDSPEETNAPRVSRAEAWPGFEQYESYWEVFDPYVEDPPCMGLLSDDVLDVWADLQPGLGLWSRGMYRAAVWEWRFGFDAHWGEHAVDAVRALHRACRKAGQA